MSTGLDAEYDTSLDQIATLHNNGGSAFDSVTDERIAVEGERSGREAATAGTARQKDDDEGSFKISKSGTFEFGNIVKIGRDGIRKSANGLLSRNSHSRTPSISSPTSTSSPFATALADPSFTSGDSQVPVEVSTTEGQQHSDPHQADDTIFSRGKMLFEDLVVLGNLGSGASANVKKVVHRLTGREYAKKVIELDARGDTKAKTILAEYLTLIENDCEYVIDLFETFCRNGNIYMVLEYMNCGSLRDIIDTCGAIPEHALSKIAYQILKGLEFAHSKNVIHRDIKPENILANHLGVVKLADFGMAGFRKDSGEFDTFQGTFTYMSPERLSADQHTFNSDIWSVGLTLLECAIGRFPIDLADVNIWHMVEVMQNISQRITIPDTLSPEFRNFISDCLKMDADARPSASQLLEYEFIVKHHQAKPSLRRWINESFVAKKKQQRRQRQLAKQQQRQQHA